MTKWQNAPAFGVVLGKLVELHARLVHVDVEKKRQRIKHVQLLLEKTR